MKRLAATSARRHQKLNVPKRNRSASASSCIGKNAPVLSGPLIMDTAQTIPNGTIFYMVATSAADAELAYNTATTVNWTDNFADPTGTFLCFSEDSGATHTTLNMTGNANLLDGSSISDETGTNCQAISRPVNVRSNMSVKLPRQRRKSLA